nr:MAG: hypothetical protein [Microviridae sp.]
MNFPKVHSTFDPAPAIKEKNSGEMITEQAGYIPPHIQIEDMMLAGQRLQQARAERFDFPDGKVDDTFIDPTRKSNFDLADASAIAMETEARLKQQERDHKAAVKALKAEKEEKKEEKNG